MRQLNGSRLINTSLGGGCLNADEALAICIANLKGSKDKDLLATAKALRYLRGLAQYPSNAKVGEAVGVSGEIVREFLTLLRFPPEIEALFEQKVLTGLEQGRRLWQLTKQRPELLNEMAKAMATMTAMDSRHLVSDILKNRGLSVTEAQKRMSEARTVREEEYHVIAILPTEQYKQLSRQAGNKRVSVDKLVTSIVQQWLEMREKHA